MGLAMSRSFGDSIVHGLGVAADPEVSEHAVQQGDLFLILATDGVWDVLDNAAAVALVHQHLTHSTGDWNTFPNAGPPSTSCSSTTRASR
mmetsp:Transcript_5277/g.18745  ORF Transcript_5277/g.18745 Transcript_5277/m.18745 type:complete len:90 (-) Transcript_5277:368-637(-)